MTATRKVDMIRGDRAMHGLPSSFNVVLGHGISFRNALFPDALCSFAFKQGHKEDRGQAKSLPFLCNVFSTVIRLYNSKCRFVEVMRKEKYCMKRFIWSILQCGEITRLIRAFI